MSSIITSPELFINMKKIPTPDSAEYDSFIKAEMDKLIYGLTINGTYISNWLYWHICHWKLYRPEWNDKRGEVLDIYDNPQLRDNEWLIAESLIKAKKEKKGVIIVGSRRISKTSFIGSWVGLGATIYEGSQNIIVGNNKHDIGNITSQMDKGLNSLSPFLRYNRIKDDWKSQVSLGFKYKDGGSWKTEEWSQIHIRNTEDGVNTEVLAGLTPKTLVYDEIGKAKIKEVFLGSIPAYNSPYGWRCIPILVGCLTANNKVFTKNGNLINVEELKYEDGIIGFNKDIQSTSLEDIININPPQEKECYKIVTYNGSTIECSFDHPILIKNRKGLNFIETKNIKAGKLLSLPSHIPLTGIMEMEQPYEKGFNCTILPFNIHLHRRSDICDLVAGLFDSRGRILTKTNNIIVCVDKEELIDSLKLLLIRLGIHSSKRFIKAKGGNYKLTISDRESALIFINTINSKKENLSIIKESIKNRKSKIDIKYQGVIFEKIKTIENIGIKPVYNLTTNKTHTYLANGIITHNTGGDMRKSEDAQEMFNDPDRFNLISVDVPNEQRKTGIFMSGLMAVDIPKDPMPLSQFLEVDKGSELDNIVIHVSNKEKGLEKINNIREGFLKSNNQVDYLKAVMYAPLTVDECFMTDEAENPFPVEALKKHLEFLKRQDTKTFVKLYRDVDGKVNYSVDTKRFEIKDFPATKDTNKNAPIVMYEPPMPNCPTFLYVGGNDQYNQNKSEISPSLGTTHIFKRTYDVIAGTFQNRIVASYAARPETVKEWSENVEMLLELYNAVCMIENEATNLIQYMENRNKIHYLADGYNLAKEINPKSSIQGRVKGLPATVKIKNHYKNLIIQYCTEKITIAQQENGEPIEALGLVRIPDEMLIVELINYKLKGNFDRIVSFGHALIYDEYLQKIAPNVKVKNTEDVVQKKTPQQRSPFIMSKASSNPFGL